MSNNDTSDRERSELLGDTTRTGMTAQDHAERLREEGEDPGEFIYYTTYSDVYHTTPECPHLDGSDRVWLAGSLYLLSTFPEPYCTGPRDTLNETTECSWCENHTTDR